MYERFILWLDRKELCPHALVERVIGTDAPETLHFLYDWGLRACTRIYFPDLRR
jgi:hypothetical protein